MEELKKTWQKCQNEEIDKKFTELHSKIVNQIIIEKEKFKRPPD